jgi:hypothetical protein
MLWDDRPIGMEDRSVIASRAEKITSNRRQTLELSLSLCSGGLQETPLVTAMLASAKRRLVPDYSLSAARSMQLFFAR